MKGRLIQLLISLVFWLSLLFISGDLQRVLEKLKAKQKTEEPAGSVSVDRVRFTDENGVQTLSFTMRNDSPDEVCYDEEAHLYLRHGDGWISITPREGFGPAQKTAVLAPGSESAYAVILTERYDRLIPGGYRLSKMIGCLAVDVDFTVE